MTQDTEMVAICGDCRQPERDQDDLQLCSDCRKMVCDDCRDGICHGWWPDLSTKPL